MIERFPYLYGLVRTGIAPDHEADKRVASEFSQILQRDNVRLFGNVNVTDDAGTAQQFGIDSMQRIGLHQLMKDYPLVVLAYGSQKDRLLGCENETASGVYSARAFAAWYNSSHEQL